MIYCVGETSEQRDAEQIEEVLNEQLSIFKTLVDFDWRKAIIVYEPLWAMATSVIASAD